MKKALTISIAKTLFTIEEDAYAALAAYLESVKIHFADTSEVVSDIEGRIAEKFLESKEKIVTLEMVESVIASIGKVEDFDDEPKNADESFAKKAEPGRKKLYRDTDDMVIAGVCSGLGAYLGVDAVWIRVMFVLLTIANGFGILIYIVLWLSMPAAETASQKLEMSGSPITLETLSETIKDRVDELEKKHGGRAGKALAAPFRAIGAIIRAVVRLLVKIVPTFVRVIVGIVLVAASLGLLVAATILSGIVFSGTPVLLDGLSLSALLPGATGIVLAGALTAVAIPLLFILLGGIAILGGKRTVSAAAALTLLGIWFIGLAITGYGAAQVAGNFDAVAAASPSYQTVSVNIPLNISPENQADKSFDSVFVQDGLELVIVPATATTSSPVEPTLSASGRAAEVSLLETRVEDGTLFLSRAPRKKWCIFCSRDKLTLTLSTLALKNVEVEFGSTVRSESMPATKDFSLVVHTGSEADLTFENSADSPSLDTFSVEADFGSRVTLSGSADKAVMTFANGSRGDLRDMVLAEAEVTATFGSTVRLSATEKLTASASNGSNIIYSGNPETSLTESFGGTVRQEKATEW